MGLNMFRLREVQCKLWALSFTPIIANWPFHFCQQESLVQSYIKGERKIKQCSKDSPITSNSWNPFNNRNGWLFFFLRSHKPQAINGVVNTRMKSIWFTHVASLSSSFSSSNSRSEQKAKIVTLAAKESVNHFSQDFKYPFLAWSYKATDLNENRFRM